MSSASRRPRTLPSTRASCCLTIATQPGPRNRGGRFRVAAAVTAARVGQLEQAAAFLSAAEAAAGLWQDGPWPAALEEAHVQLALASGWHEDGRARLRAAGDGFAHHGRRLDADRLEQRLAFLA
jgi:hypothetical protein